MKVRSIEQWLALDFERRAERLGGERQAWLRLPFLARYAWRSHD